MTQPAWAIRSRLCSTLIVVQPDGRLVEQVERRSTVGGGAGREQLADQAQSSPLAPRERRGRLAEGQVSEADGHQLLERRSELGLVGERRQPECLGGAEVEQVGDAPAVDPAGEHLVAVATAPAGIAGQLDPGEEAHVRSEATAALAALAATALDVEREVLGGQAARPGVVGGGEASAHPVEGAEDLGQLGLVGGSESLDDVGLGAAVVTEGLDTPVAFDRDVLRMSPEKAGAYWIDRLVRDRLKPLLALQSAATDPAPRR